MQRSNRLDNYRAHLDSLFNFSFAEPKSKPAKGWNPSSTLLTGDEKRSLGMWLTTVLEVHTDQFLHALKHCRILSIGEFYCYFQVHYSHLKAIIRFYIIALLIDYNRICQSSAQRAETDKPCIFLNIIIEELTTRFFRESQWLHKINHLPVYIIFPIFDPFAKGYTTLRQILGTLEAHFVDLQKLKQLKGNSKKSRQLKKLVQRKLSCNIGQGDDPRIYQENLEEVMVRANLIAFDASSGGKGEQWSSRRFQGINQEMEKWREVESEKKRMEMYDELKKSKREEEELDLLRQDYEIKQKSELMSRQQYQSEMQKQQSWRSTAYKDQFTSAPNSTQLYQTNHKYSTACKPQNHTEFHSNPKSSERLAYSLSNRKENTSDFYNKGERDALMFCNMAETQKNKSKLALRMVIMNELKVLREEKNKNYRELLDYI